MLRQPVENIYLVSTSVMDLLLHLDALDSVAFSGTKAEGWYLPAVQQAMEEGKIAYAGKYSAPDYEQILADRKSTRLNSSHITRSRMPSSA